MNIQNISKTIKTANTVKHYFRAKYIPDSGGGFRLSMIQESNFPIFLEDGYEPVFDKPIKKADVKKDSAKNITSSDNIERNSRAARIRAFEYILCNTDLNAFVTFTYNPESVDDRTSYDECYNVLSSWLDNRVKRNGLKYVIVSERHKKGGIHFHGIMNREALKLEKALNPYTKSVIKHKGRTVYNLLDWKKNGFSTVELIGKENSDRDAVAKYIFKYMTKERRKIGARYFLHGGNLKTPIYKYGDCFDELDEHKIAIGYKEVKPTDSVIYREWRYI